MERLPEDWPGAESPIVECVRRREGSALVAFVVEWIGTLQMELNVAPVEGESEAHRQGKRLYQLASRRTIAKTRTSCVEVGFLTAVCLLALWEFAGNHRTI